MASLTTDAKSQVKVLVAEGQKVMRRAIMTYLEEHHFQVSKAGDERGLEILLGEQADLLLLDTTLVKGTLAEFLVDLRRQKPQLAVILMTYPDQQENLEKLQLSEKVECLIKPFPIESLENSIRRLIEKETVPTEDNSTECYLNLDDLPSVHRHPAMKKAIGLLNGVANSDITVLISGESGVGKEIFAHTLHMRSNRAQHPFVGLNCASVPASLLEAELFGSERGAYTGSVSKRMGKFEMAQKGMLLLDEVSEMDISLQTKLLRVIQEKELYRVGGETRIHLDVRIIATTNRDLRDWVKKGNFREDLYYRLNVIPIHIPALRERPEDIPILAQYIMGRFNRENKGKNITLTPQAVAQLSKYSWPGNIRELENILIRTAFLSSNQKIDKIDFEEEIAAEAPVTAIPTGEFKTIDEMERQMIRQALETYEGNRVRTATALGISVRTLRNKLRLYREEGLATPDDPDERSALN